jgi:hypothetical protein
MPRNVLAALGFACAACFPLPALAQDAPHLVLELNKAETVGTGCRVTFKATNNFPERIDEFNVEVYLVDGKGVVMQSVQFPFGFVPNGKSRFAKFDVKNTECASIGGMYVNEFKTCKGKTDLAIQCRESLKTANLTAITFSDGGL